VPAQQRVEPVRHPGRVAGTAQVTSIFDLPPSPAPAGEVPARSVAGTHQVHHRSPGNWPGRARFGPRRSGHWPPRAAPSGPGAARCPGRSGAGSRPRRRRRVPGGSSGPAPGGQDERRAPSARSCDASAPRPGITGGILGPAGPSPHRKPAPAKEASGSVNRLLRPGSVRHMSVTTAAQRRLLTGDGTR
jgi:hypothetical protein